jgi:hypothetical protein
MPNTREKLIELLETVVSPNEVLCDGEVLVSTARVADHLIANGVTFATDNNVGSKWIPVTERLPEKDVRVLVWMQDNEEGYTQMDTDRFSCTMEQGYHWIRWGKSVTHWMPLPEPPKGE